VTFGGVVIGPVLASPGAGIGGMGLWSLRSRAGLPPRGLPTGAALTGADGFAAFAGALPFATGAVFVRATFEGFAVAPLRENLALLRFATGAFALRAGVRTFLTAAFFAIFLAGFLTALRLDLATFLAGFFAATIRNTSLENSCLYRCRVRLGAISAPDTLQDL
jgi:hypothetical protein